MHQTKMHANILSQLVSNKKRRKEPDFSQAQTSKFTSPQCNEREVNNIIERG